MLLVSINFFITIFIWIIYNKFIFNLKVYYDTMIEIYVLLMFWRGTYGTKMVFRSLGFD